MNIIQHTLNQKNISKTGRKLIELYKPEIELALAELFYKFSFKTVNISNPNEMAIYFWTERQQRKDKLKISFMMQNEDTQILLNRYKSGWLIQLRNTHKYTNGAANYNNYFFGSDVMYFMEDDTDQMKKQDVLTCIDTFTKNMYEVLEKIKTPIL